MDYSRKESEDLDKYIYAQCHEGVTFMYLFYYITEDCYQRLKEVKNADEASPEAEDDLMLAAADMPRAQAFRPGVWPGLDKPQPASWLYCKEDGRFYYHVFHNGRHYAVAPGSFIGNEVSELVRTVIDGKEVVLGKGFEVDRFEGEEDWKTWYEERKNGGMPV